MPSYSRRVKIPNKSSQELYDKVTEGLDHFLSKASLGSYEILRNPEKKEFQVKSSLFSAKLTCLEAEMALDAQLSLLATPFRSKLDDAIDRWLAKTFDLKKLS